VQRLVVSSAQVTGDTLSLTPDQQHYLRRVLRLQPGDRFLALDGQGALWLATLTATAEQARLAAPPSDGIPDQSAPAPQIVLAACLPKQGFDEVVRQVTELGVAEIVPILSDRTLLHPSPNKLRRWRRILAEAAEQSERLTIPVLNDPLSWRQWLEAEVPGRRCLCVARRLAPPLLTVGLAPDAQRIIVAVGPEGGWTEAEVEQAIAADYQAVTLGSYILRAVTAAVIAVSTLQLGIEFARMGLPTE